MLLAIRATIMPSLAGILACLTLSAPSRADETSPEQAQFLKSCGTCHTIERDAAARQGPNLAGIMGRTAGALAEFATYSDAIKQAGAAGLVWNEETLDKWIADGAAMIPGSNMFYSQPDPEKRKLIVSYLKSLPAAEDK